MKRVGVWLCRIAAVTALYFGIFPLMIGVRHLGVWLLLGWGALLFFLSVWRPPATGGIRRLFGFLTAGMVLCSAVGLLLSLMMAQAAWLCPPTNQPATVIVLGCKATNGMPSLMLQRRIDAAAEYLLAHPDQSVIATGGLDSVSETSTEAQVIADRLILAGVTPDRIYREDRSSDTRENLAFAAEIIREKQLPTSVVIVTDPFHQLRAHCYADRNNLEAASITASTPWGLALSYWVREWGGLAVLLLPEQR